MSHRRSRQIREILGSNLHDARDARGLSQSELARRLDFKPSAIAHFEKGRRMPSVETLVKLADILKVPVAFLIGRDEEAEAPAPAMQQLLDAAARLSERDLQTVTSLANDLAKRK